MAEYAILHINKLKGSKDLVHASNHNFRKTLSSNVDEEKIKDNRQLKGDSGVSYAKVFKDTIKESDYYKTHDVAKNAVLGYEVLLTMSREMKDKVDLDKWCESNVKWLEKEFGEYNVKNAVLHLDEETPHIHAFVVPMTEKGKLCSEYFFDGKRGLMKLQDSYAEQMSAFGLERGVRYSRAKRKDIKEFYNRIEDALRISERARVEMKDEFTRRADEAEEDYTDRVANAMSNFALKAEEDRKRVEELEKKLRDLNTKIAEIESLTDIVLGDELADMIRFALKESRDEKMKDIFKKMLVWASNEYNDHKLGIRDDIGI